MTDDASSALTGPGSAGTDDHPGAGPALAGTDAEDTPEPVYLAVEDWVIDYFLPMFRRTLGGDFRWCTQWWQHGEAISRLSALWHAWEVLRLQPGTGIATWYRDHLDHQLPILMGARGPFYQCSETAHREPHQAAVIPAPAEWWDTDDVDMTVPGDLAGPAVTVEGLPPVPGGLLPGHDDVAGMGDDNG
jgi:hypothetical protein